MLNKSVVIVCLLLLAGCSGSSWAESKLLYKEMDFGSPVQEIGKPLENAGKLWWRLGVSADFSLDRVRYPDGFKLVPQSATDTPLYFKDDVWTFGSRTALLDDGDRSCGISMSLNGTGPDGTPPAPSELGVGISCVKSLAKNR